MEYLVGQIYQNLQKMTGFHRQLLELVRLERQALVQADRTAIHAHAVDKLRIVEEIQQAEMLRLKLIGELAAIKKKSINELTLPKLIISLQGDDPKSADQFRSTLNALTILIQRIDDQNKDNKILIERSLSNIDEMKKNVLSEARGKANTYNPQGQRSSVAQPHRMISKEA